MNGTCIECGSNTTHYTKLCNSCYNRKYYNKNKIDNCVNINCGFCGKLLNGVHPNRKYCSAVCENKMRYEKHGQRSTPEQRSKWYKLRKNQEGYSAKLRSQAKNRYYDIQLFLRTYKVNVGCVDCGYILSRRGVAWHAGWNVLG